MCDAWTTLDLICCTSSILHLLAISLDRHSALRGVARSLCSAISLDRYWAVTRLDYIHNRSTRRIAAMIVASWAGSIVISAPPLFIHSDPHPDVTGQSA